MTSRVTGEKAGLWALRRGYITPASDLAVAEQSFRVQRQIYDLF